MRHDIPRASVPGQSLDLALDLDLVLDLGHEITMCIELALGLAA